MDLNSLESAHSASVGDLFPTRGPDARHSCRISLAVRCGEGHENWGEVIIREQSWVEILIQGPGNVVSTSDIEAKASESGPRRRDKWILDAVRCFLLRLRRGQPPPTVRLCTSSCLEDISDRACLMGYCDGMETAGTKVACRRVV